MVHLKALKNYNQAIIPREKFTQYALNSAIPGKGKDKAIAFNQYLGYNQDNVDELISEIFKKLSEYEAVFKGNNLYGDKYQVDILIDGANGNTVNVRTGWLYEPGSDIPRMVTVYVKPIKR